jgi:HEAT repeat protein
MRTTLSFLIVAGLTLAADEKAPEQKQAAELVKQLGHPKYTVREAAAKRLLDLGPSAVAAIAEGTKATDEEVRNRCIALLPQAKAVEWKRRSAAFLADAEGKQKHDLPLLADWEKLVGKLDTGSRKIFADMIRVDGELLEAVAADKKTASKLCTDRCKIVLAEVRTGKGQIKADRGDIAAVLFVDTLSPMQYDWSSQAFPCNLLGNPTLIESLGDTEVGPVFRRLLMKWAETRPSHDSFAFQRFASLVQKKPFPEAGAYLAKLAKDKKADVLSVRLLAVQALGKVGGREAAEALAELVSETTPLFNGGGFGNEEYRLGDSAFAALLTMNGKKLADYGLRHQGGIGFGTGDGDEIISLELHSFGNADERAKAIKKWKDEIAQKKEAKDKK